MGETAAQMLLHRIQFPHEAYPEMVTFEPELMVRESTGPARPLTSSRSRTKTRTARSNGSAKS
jgi:hypothetical protein